VENPVQNFHTPQPYWVLIIIHKKQVVSEQKLLFCVCIYVYMDWRITLFILRTLYLWIEESGPHYAE